MGGRDPHRQGRGERRELRSQGRHRGELYARYVAPFWVGYLKRVDRIGAHIFYAMRDGVNWAPGALNGNGDRAHRPQLDGKRAELFARLRNAGA